VFIAALIAWIGRGDLALAFVIAVLTTIPVALPGSTIAGSRVSTR
jgi:hypothetical protein